MRRLRIGLLTALVAVAVSSLGAAGANAAEGTFTVSAGSTAFTGAQTGTSTLTLQGGRVFSCATSTLKGTVENGATSIDYEPTYAECVVKVGGVNLPSTVNGTGCFFRQRNLKPVIGKPDTFTTTTDLICPAGATGLHITWYANAAAHAANTPLCIDTVPPFAGIPGPHATTNTTGTISFNSTEVELAAERTLGTIANCGEAKFVAKSNGTSLVTPSSGTLDIH